MAKADDDETPRSTATAPVSYAARESLVAEVLWALMLPRSDSEQRAAAQLSRFVRSPGLEERIRSFWADGESCFTELLVLAGRAGVLFEDDFDAVIAGLERAAAGLPGSEALQSETEGERACFRDRLDRLHHDADLRRRWLGLIRDAWAEAAPVWDAQGRPQAEVYGSEIRARLARRTYEALVPVVECDFHGMLPRLVRQYAEAGDPVVVVPSWLAFRGYVLTLPGALVVVVSVPGRERGPTAETRERARRFKALSDATRLAILEATGYRPRTIGELASAIQIAQPTVSNHVRILRDAGLLEQLRDGSRRLSPVPDALRRLTEESLVALGAD
jgi:DNA-binding transcriptional ArsR family regulator